jgi:hypothetical protein
MFLGSGGLSAVESPSRHRQHHHHHHFRRVWSMLRCWSCCSVRSFTAVLMLLAITVIFPLFFTDKIRQINLLSTNNNHHHHDSFTLDDNNLIPSFKKQPRDRIKSTRKYTLEPNVCSGINLNFTT